MLRDYLLKRWFFIAAMIGIMLAIRAPEFSRAVFSYADIRYISAVGLFFMSISLATSRLWEAIRQPGPVMLALFVTWGIAPILGYVVGSAMLPLQYREGLIVVCCVPCTLASASVWTGMGGGNQAIALMMTMLTNSLVFIGTASWLAFLTGTQVEFDTGKMMSQLVVYVVVPIIIAQSLRAVPIIGRAADRRKSTISLICRLCVLLIIVKSAVDTNTRLSAGGAGAQAWSAFELVQVALICSGVHLVLLLVGYFGAIRLFGRSDAMAVGIAGSQKTLPVAALLVDQFYSHVPLAIVPVLFYHVCQLIIDTYFTEIIVRQPSATVEPPADEVITS